MLVSPRSPCFKRFMKVIAVIPARFNATRLPGKPLADIGGKPMIQWVYEAACRAKNVHEVYVATDDEKVASTVHGFGGQVMITSPDCQSGTDRVAEVALRTDGTIYVNVQGDEPLIEADVIDSTVQVLLEGDFYMASAVTKLYTREDLLNQAVVKAIVARDGKALYFSRYPIPYSRQSPPDTGFICRRHLGIYAYTRATLLEITALPPTELERAESLEQLRALEHGIEIGLTEVTSSSVGIDTPEDLAAVRSLVAQMPPETITARRR